MEVFGIMSVFGAIRPVVTATTGGAGNIPVSIAEDAASTLVSVLSVVIPVIAVCLLIAIVVIVSVILVKKRKKKTKV